MRRKYAVLKSKTSVWRKEMCANAGRAGAGVGRERLGAAVRERSELAWKFGVDVFVAVVLRCLVQTVGKSFISF